MNSRERVLAAINQKDPDALPVGFRASVEVLQRLTRHFGAETLRDLIASMPVDTYGLFNNSMPGVFPSYVGGPVRVLYPRSYPDGTWDTFYGYRRRWVSAAGGKNDEVIRNPLADAQTTGDLEKYDWPQADWFDYSTIAGQYREANDKAVIFLAGSLWQSAHLVGFERILTEMAVNPVFVEFCFAKLADFFVELTERTLIAAGRRIDIVCVQDDFGTQDGSLISLEMYRRYFRPHHKRIFDTAHRCGAKVMQHSCGATSDFIPDFIDLGVDILDPVQIGAVGMDPTRLKRKFGKDLCFHGGIDTQNILLKGTPADVCQQIDALVETLGDGGGYILAPSHYIQADTPMQNLLAIFEYVARWR